MLNRITLEALSLLGVAGESVVIRLVLSQRITKVVCRIDVEGVGASVLSVADKKGAVKYWSGFVDGLVEVARCMPVTAGNYAVVIENGALLSTGPAKTNAELRAEIIAALIVNDTQTTAAQNQVSLLADVPNMVDCLLDEKATLTAKLATLPA